MDTLMHEGLIRVRFTPQEADMSPEHTLDGIAKVLHAELEEWGAEAEVVREAVMLVTAEDREAFEDAARALEAGAINQPLAARFREFAVHESMVEAVEPITTLDHKAVGGL